MPRITSKGQVTIPREIRHMFGFMPGMEVDIIVKDNRAVIVKSRHKNPFTKWLGRGKAQAKNDVDQLVDQMRGRTDA